MPQHVARNMACKMCLTLFLCVCPLCRLPIGISWQRQQCLSHLGPFESQQLGGTGQGLRRGSSRATRIVASSASASLASTVAAGGIADHEHHHESRCRERYRRDYRAGREEVKNQSEPEHERDEPQNAI